MPLLHLRARKSHPLITPVGSVKSFNCKFFGNEALPLHLLSEGLAILCGGYKTAVNTSDVNKGSKKGKDVFLQLVKNEFSSTSLSSTKKVLLLSFCCFSAR